MKTFSFFLLNILLINTTHAQSGRPFGEDGIFFGLFTDLTGLISKGVIGLIIGMTIAAFFWALFRGMLRSQGGKEMAENKNTIFWGIAILFVMISIWGIIVFFQDALIKDYKNKDITLPTIPVTGTKRPASDPSPNGGEVRGLPTGSGCEFNYNCISGRCEGIPRECKDGRRAL